MLSDSPPRTLFIALTSAMKIHNARDICDNAALVNLTVNVWNGLLAETVSLEPKLPTAFEANERLIDVARNVDILYAI